jgi:hypothetical protein
LVEKAINNQSIDQPIREEKKIAQKRMLAEKKKITFIQCHQVRSTTYLYYGSFGEFAGIHHYDEIDKTTCTHRHETNKLYRANIIHSFLHVPEDPGQSRENLEGGRAAHDFVFACFAYYFFSIVVLCYVSSTTSTCKYDTEYKRTNQ